MLQSRHRRRPRTASHRPNLEFVLFSCDPIVSRSSRLRATESAGQVNRWAARIDGKLDVETCSRFGVWPSYFSFTHGTESLAATLRYARWPPLRRIGRRSAGLSRAKEKRTGQVSGHPEGQTWGKRQPQASGRTPVARMDEQRDRGGHHGEAHSRHDTRDPQRKPDDASELDVAESNRRRDQSAGGAPAAPVPAQFPRPRLSTAPRPPRVAQWRSGRHRRARSGFAARGRLVPKPPA